MKTVIGVCICMCFMLGLWLCIANAQGWYSKRANRLFVLTYRHNYDATIHSMTALIFGALTQFRCQPGIILARSFCNAMQLQMHNAQRSNM